MSSKASGMQGEEWLEVLSAVTRLANEFEDIVFIGGVAVYLHLVNTERRPEFIEFSHDIDAFLSLPDLADMRDVYVVTNNRRLNKHQIEIGQVEVDLYVDHSNSLAIPYDQIRAHHRCYDQLKVAALEHLLVLKLDAALDRRNSPKGAKDLRDVVKIVHAMQADMAPAWDRALLDPYLTDDRRQFLHQVAKSQAFMEIARGNAHLAKSIREGYERFLSDLGGDKAAPPTRPRMS